RLTMNNNLLKSYSEEEFKKHLTTVIRTLKKDYARTRSEQINYYMHLIFLIYNEKYKKYNLAIKYCKQLISLINKSNVIYRKERIGFALDNLSQYKTFTGNFYYAARYSREAQSYYLENSYNYIASKGQEFHVYFYHQKYDKALVCSMELLEHSLSNAGKFRRSKFIYYQACSHFALGNYKNALSLLNASMEIEKDKSGWNIALRILIIMIFIELNKIDEASTTLESLRKSIERTAKNDDITQRDILIVKLLRALEKDGFEYTGKNVSVEKILQKLSLPGTDTSWSYYLPELIPFHNWLLNHKK
ncbi:MAG: tetratricopeptide repeat protein, partial [Bacteroidia bacterium]